jgi:3-phenylpropionate/trans-cinnamate dioxygenase ferredoxin reductase subunit
VLPADLVVVGIGAQPATDWLEGSGVDLDDGVVCDERLRVLAGGRAVPGVVAAGDVARWWHRDWGERVRVDHWTNAAEQGDAAAGTLLEGDDAPAFTPVPYVWSDQYERKLQVMGRVGPDDDMAVLEEDREDNRLLAAFGRHGRLVGAVGLGRPAKVMRLGRRIAEGGPFPPEA